MSFGDGNVREKLEELQGRYDALVVVACFMADRMQSINYKEYGPASWDYIQRELGKLGIREPFGKKAADVINRRADFVTCKCGGQVEVTDRWFAKCPDCGRMLFT